MTERFLPRDDYGHEIVRLVFYLENISLPPAPLGVCGRAGGAQLDLIHRDIYFYYRPDK